MHISSIRDLEIVKNYSEKYDVIPTILQSLQLSTKQRIFLKVC